MSAITLADFKKIDLRCAKVVEVEEISGADKIWKIAVDVGGERKTIVAGIKLGYPKEALIGRTVILVNNLEPAVIRGVESNGMLLCAKDGASLSLLSPDKDVPSGSSVG